MNTPSPVSLAYSCDCTEIELVRALLRHFGFRFEQRRVDPAVLHGMTNGVVRIHVRLDGCELLTVEALMQHLLRRRGCGL